jgi:tungstate transport system substrate-binding protein
MLARRPLIAAVALVLAGAPLAQERFITLASTTGIDVRVVAVGTGQALAIGMKGDADALLVHDRAGEDKFVAGGHGLERRDVMHNDFVIVGPKSDPAGVRGLGDAKDAFRRIADEGAAFASRGDDSGTHRMELRLWRAAGADKPSGAWYRELGQGMGPTLNTAAGLNAYALTDRATWANFKNRQDLAILLEGDAALFNPYGSLLVDPGKGRHIKAADARAWHEWLASDTGRAAIGSFRIDGEQLFFPSAPSPRS